MKYFLAITTACSDDFNTGAKSHPGPVTKVTPGEVTKVTPGEVTKVTPGEVTKVTPGEVWILIKYRSIFTLRESLGGRISFVVQNSRYMYTASPWTPRSCNLRNFCNIED
jgi:hypothetical protein